MAHAAELRARSATFWNQAAPGWIRHADRQDRLGRPLGAAAFDRLRTTPGERVLDVGCGCGGTTAELATAVGPTGAVVGVDLSEAMVTAAQRRFPGLRFVAGDIETAGELPGEPFDAVFSRMTLMLLANPVAGLSAIARSMRPNARLAATVFRDAGAVPWMPAAVLGAAPHVGALPPLPIGTEPGPFAFADPARITRVLTAAGFDEVTVEPADVTLDTEDEPEPVAEWLIEIGPAGAAYRDADTGAQEAARAGVMRLIERFRTPSVGYRLPAGLWLITAKAPDPRSSRRPPTWAEPDMAYGPGMRTVLGLGARADVPEAELATAIDAALRQAGLDATGIAALATLDRRAAEAGVRAVARRHGWPVLEFAAASLTAITVPHPSATVAAAAGTASVAEAAALLAAGPGAVLILPKTVFPRVAVAIAAVGWRPRW